MRAIGRVIATLIGFMLAVAAAALFLVVAEVGWPSPVGGDVADAMHFWVQFGLAYGFAVSLLGAAAFIPACLLILFTEIVGLRTIVFYLPAGGALGGAAALGLSSRLAAAARDGSSATLLIATGVVGAFVYWLIAGRMAGLSPSRPPDDRTGA